MHSIISILIIIMHIFNNNYSIIKVRMELIFIVQPFRTRPKSNSILVAVYSPHLGWVVKLGSLWHRCPLLRLSSSLLLPLAAASVAPPIDSLVGTSFAMPYRSSRDICSEFVSLPSSSIITLVYVIPQWITTFVFTFLITLLSRNQFHMWTYTH